MTKNDAPSKTLVRIEDGYLVLNDGDMWDYEIHINQLKSKSQINQWLEHLSEKRWFSEKMKSAILSLLDEVI